jgi:RimJ/RimL family protein N-acetyltransferase
VSRESRVADLTLDAPFPTLDPVSSFEDDRVTLRPIGASDREQIAGYLNDPAVLGLRQIEGDGLAPIGEAKVAAVVEEWAATKSGLALAICPAGDDGVVGHALCDWGWDAMNPWIGIVVAPEHRRRGYGTAAAALVVSWVFGHTVAHAIQAWTPAWNDPGIAFSSALGFSPAGRVRNAWLRDGMWHDDLAFDLLRSEWEAR